ncbi:MAG: hypothetical protein HRU04_18580 [Oceanospirillaceae bacterium]|nr:hypothetical protein [Oceanospirillaceae bacterium]
MKDAEAPDTFAYDFQTLTTHFDEDGDPVSTLVLIQEGRQATSSENKPSANNHQAIWQSVGSPRAIGESVTVQVVRDDLKAQGFDKTALKNFGRWVNKLVEDGQLICILFAQASLIVFRIVRLLVIVEVSPGLV